MESTTKYNHNTIGTAALPLIPNVIFKGLCDELRNGDKEFYELLKTEYTFESTQKRVADQLLKEIL